MDASATQHSQTQIKVLPIMIAFLMSGFIGLFSETALNMALADLMREFEIRETTVQWLTTGYLLVLGILVPVSGLLLQRFTTRQLFIAALSFSVVGTLVAALSPTFTFLMGARVIQAIGTGLLLPLMFNTILLIFPPEKRGAAMGMIGLVIMFAPAVGPTISGLIIEHLTWHWIFWISLPVLVFSLIFGIIYMQNVSETKTIKLDALSILLSTIGFGGIVFGFSSAGEGDAGWLEPKVLISIGIGVLFLILFSLRQVSMDQPMINLKVFKYPMFTIGLVMIFICMMVILSSMLLLPIYLQGGLVLTGFVAGLLLLPGGVVNGLISPVMGRLFDKYGPKWLVIPGFIIISVVLWFFTTINTASTTAFIIVLHTCLMIGVAMVMMPAQTNGLNQLPKQFYPDGTAVMNTLQQIAGAIGTAVAASIMASGQKDYMATVKNPADPSVISASITAGTQHAFVFILTVAIIGFLGSLFIKRVNVKEVS
ncbi:lincomycin efflux MFS transporter Lmr(B) [Priestia koreensis]|uniref:lincomycin efflux MFS transporter Lmr(B) n=1 Tax=Priestia koreensis TaxID=284581 RepID=UPI00345AC2D1